MITLNLDESVSHIGKLMGQLNKRFNGQLTITPPKWDGPLASLGGIGYQGKKGYYHAFNWNWNLIDMEDDYYLDDMERVLKPWLEKVKEEDNDQKNNRLLS